MASQTSPAIAVHHVRYGDTSAISQLFTRESGYLPFMVRGMGSKKHPKRQLLQPLTLLEVEYSLNEQREVQSLKSIKRAEVTLGLQQDVVKSAQALFLGEFLYRTFEQHYQNSGLFDYLWRAIRALDQAAFPANLHVKILVDLTRYYGIQPQNAWESAGSFLDLETGSYTDQKPAHPYYCSPEQTRMIQILAGMNFEESQALSMGRIERNALLDKLIEYYQLRYAGLNTLNSRLVLQTVFDA